MPDKQNMMICIQGIVGQGIDERQKPVLDIQKALAAFRLVQIVVM